MKHLKKTRRPIVLTVNGKAEAVVQHAEAYQRLLDIAARADAVESIRRDWRNSLHRLRISFGVGLMKEPVLNYEDTSSSFD
ncbi:MAG: hypothetical protein JO185_17130, partial [Acidobacteriaceae bacterium]|nr:hypothetical protein [Acidobacteriaceae bacterium]